MAHRSVLVVLLVAVIVLLPAVARAPDTTPPWAVNWGPMGSGVPVDTALQVVWSERMNWTSVTHAFSYTDGTTVFTAGTWSFDDATNSSTFVPATLLQPKTGYTVEFASTATDLAENPLDQNRNGAGGEPCNVLPPAAGDCVIWQFETVGPPPDTAPPHVLSTSPADGAVASTDVSIAIRFNETMDTASVEAALTYSDGFTLYRTSDGTASWTAASVADDTLLFGPRLEFASGSQVTVYLESYATDTTGNHLDGNGDGLGGDPYTWTFFIAADPRPPTVLATSPAAGSGGVSVSGSFQVVFSKSMFQAAVDGALSVRAPGEPTLRIDNGSASWSGTRFPDDTLVFGPDPNLRTSTAYEFGLSADTARDREGLYLDGNGNGTAEGSPTDDLRLPFSTETEDRTPPTVMDRRPAIGAIDVYVETDILVVFSEPMDRASMEAAFSYTDGAATFNASDGRVWWLSADTIFDLLPARALDYGLRYTVTLKGDIARDMAGNLLNGGPDETWNFTTASVADTTPPRILSTSPFDGQGNVSRNARISIVFSEAMDKAATQASIGITGGPVLSDFRWPNDATLEAATAAPMEYRTPYVVFVLTGAKDLAGNSLTQPSQVHFTTESWRGRVSGRVTDENHAGIGGAMVQLGHLVVLADAGGTFAFEAVEQGTYTLTVSAAGYETRTAAVDVGPDAPNLGEVVLRRPAPAVDVTLWAGLGTLLFAIVLVAVILHRVRSRPTEHYETWKPAKVVVAEPGLPPRDKP